MRIKQATFSSYHNFSNFSFTCNSFIQHFMTQELQKAAFSSPGISNEITFFIYQSYITFIHLTNSPLWKKTSDLFWQYEPTPFQFHIQLLQFFCLSKANINNSTIVFQNSNYYNFRAFAQQFSFNQHFHYVYWSSVSLAPTVLKRKQRSLIPKQIPLIRTNRLISKGIPLVPQQVPLISKPPLGKDPKIFASNSDLHTIKRIG